MECNAFNENIQNAEITDLVLKLFANKYKFTHVPKYLYRYRDSPQGLSKSANLNKNRARSIKFYLECIFPPDLFPDGTYRIGLITAKIGKEEFQKEFPALEFEVVQDQMLGKIFAGTRGLLTPKCDWRIPKYADQPT